MGLTFPFDSSLDHQFAAGVNEPTTGSDKRKSSQSQAAQHTA